MRRTLALAGAAILGITGLAGPAAADSGAGITTHQDVAISEAGIDLVDAGAANVIDGTFFDVRNDTSGTINVGGYEVRGCDATGIFRILRIPDNIMLDGGEEWLGADDTYNAAGGPTRNQALDAGVDMDQNVGALFLLDSTGTPVQTVKWGNPGDPTCLAFPSAGFTPDSNNSLNYNFSTHAWSPADPTPLRAP